MTECRGHHGAQFEGEEFPGDVQQRSRRNVCTPQVQTAQEPVFWPLRQSLFFSPSPELAQQIHKAAHKVGWHLVAISSALQCVQGLQDLGESFV